MSLPVLFPLLEELGLLFFSSNSYSLFKTQSTGLFSLWNCPWFLTSLIHHTILLDCLIQFSWPPCGQRLRQARELGLSLSSPPKPNVRPVPEQVIRKVFEGLCFLWFTFTYYTVFRVLVWRLSKIMCGKPLEEALNKWQLLSIICHPSQERKLKILKNVIVIVLL